MSENEIAKVVFECGIKIHKALGPGLLESAYEECLCYELNKNGVSFERQKNTSANLRSDKLRYWV